MGYSPWGCKELDTTECTYKHARKLTQLTWGLMQTTRVSMDTMALGQISLPPPLLGAFPFPLFSLPSPSFFFAITIPPIGWLKQKKCIYQSLKAEKVLASKLRCWHIGFILRPFVLAHVGVQVPCSLCR